MEVIGVGNSYEAALSDARSQLQVQSDMRMAGSVLGFSIAACIAGFWALILSMVRPVAGVFYWITCALAYFVVLMLIFAVTGINNPAHGGGAGMMEIFLSLAWLFWCPVVYGSQS